MLHVAIEHRLMHVETLAYILHQLPYDRKIAPEPEGRRPVAAREHWMIDIPGGVAQLGRRDDGFGWDNEFDAHEMEVPRSRWRSTKSRMASIWSMYARARRPRSSGCGAAASGLSAACLQSFRCLSIGPSTRLTNRLRPMQWHGASLPTEPQFHRAACLASGAGHNDHGGNLDFRRWDPVPVQANDRPPRFLRSWWATVGSGPRRRSRRSQVLRRFPSIKLFGAIFRWTALCPEGRFSGDRGAAVAALVPQLVPAWIPLYLCDIPAGRAMTYA